MAEALDHKRVGLPHGGKVVVVCGYPAKGWNARRFWKHVKCPACLKKRPEKKRGS